jgi:hypothetical protein
VAAFLLTPSAYFHNVLPPGAKKFPELRRHAASFRM